METSDLPDFVLAEIFSCLVDYSCPRYTANAMSRIGLVCKRWRSVLLSEYSDYLIWGRIDAVHYYMSMRVSDVVKLVQFDEVSRKTAYLVAAHISESFHQSPEMVPVPWVTEQYDRDGLKGLLEFRPRGGEFFDRALKNCTHVKWPTFVCDFAGVLWQHMSTELQSLHLTFGHPSGIFCKQESWEVQESSLMRCINGLGKLKSLRLSFSTSLNHGFPPDRMVLQPPSRQLASLRKLKLRGAAICDFKEIVKAAPNLEKLEVSGDCALVRHAPERLVSLKLAGTIDLLDSLVVALGEVSRRNFQNLKRLCLCAHSAEGADLLQKCRFLPTLENLCIECGEMMQVPMFSFREIETVVFETLQRCCARGNLKKLTMPGFNISCATDMRFLSNVEKLHVRCTGSFDEIEKIRTLRDAKIRIPTANLRHAPRFFQDGFKSEATLVPPDSESLTIAWNEFGSCTLSGLQPRRMRYKKVGLYFGWGVGESAERQLACITTPCVKFVDVSIGSWVNPVFAEDKIFRTADRFELNGTTYRIR